MKRQTIIWTAVPNGVATDGTLRLAVFVSPRLMTDEGLPTPPLSQFPDWVDWPATLAHISFQIKFGNKTITPTRLGPTPRSDLWKALFPAGTYVRPYVFKDLTGRHVRSYPAGNVYGYLHDAYRSFGQNAPTHFPSRYHLVGEGGDSTGALSDLYFSSYDKASLERYIQGVLNQTNAVPPGPPNTRVDFYQVEAFHARPRKRQIPKSFPDQPDFHQAISALNDYPALLRQLGLVCDFSVPVPSVGSPTLVQVLPTWTPSLAQTKTVKPKTKAKIGPSAFLPVSRKTDPEVAEGFLRASDPSYQLLEIDLDGAALKMLMFTDNLVRSRAYDTQDTPQSYATPALRSAGLAVVRSGRALAFVQSIKDNMSLQQLAAGGKPITLLAEDLLQGLRWDVFDVSSKQWFSLCERIGSYAFTRPNPDAKLSLRDEGIISSMPGSRADGSSNDFYLSETVARWTGESLVANRPGKSLNRDPALPPSEPPNDPLPALQLATSFRPVPGSLPPLRYGRSYRLRARAAFIGGAGLVFKAPDTSHDFSHATAEVQYARFEPIVAPVLVMRKRRTEGESVERLVIRSNYNTPAASTVPDERHLAPPKIAQLGAEHHGMFDTAAGVDPNAYGLIVARESGSFLDAGTPDPNNYGQPYYDVNTLSFPVENGKTAQIPYLPDPLSRGAAFLGLPGLPSGKVLKVGFADGLPWPDLHPFRVHLQETGSGSSFDSTHRVLNVTLPKADVVEVQLSSYMDVTDLPLLGMWKWLSSGLGSAKLSKMRTLAVNGQVWMLTPFRTVTLVHAVRQPLVAPAFHKPAPLRSLGETFATLKASVTLSRKSTVSMDLLAEWTDPVDDLAQDQPGTVDVSQTVAQIPVPLSKTSDTSFALNQRHEFHDTKYHLVTYRLQAKSRFDEYFVETAKPTLGPTPVVLNAAGVVPGSETVRSLDGATLYRNGPDYVMDYDAGSILRKAGGHIASGQKVVVRFVPQPNSRMSAPVQVRIPNSARPPAPSVQYVLPAFAWTESRTGSTVHRTRGGNLLRVYLDRPWYASGADELLGVLVYPAGIYQDYDHTYDALMTRYGLDPIAASAPVKKYPDLADFKLAKLTRYYSSIPEIGGYMSVAGHEVAFDPDRKLWYSDIEIAAGPKSYWPFVRLALARFQPHSLGHADLSPVTLAHFNQLAPNRSVTVASQPNPMMVRITVTGYSYRAMGFASGPPPIMVRAQIRDPDIPGELGWVWGTGENIIQPQVGADGLATWRQSMELPAKLGSQPMRLVITEYDEFGDFPARRLRFLDVVTL